MVDSGCLMLDVRRNLESSSMELRNSLSPKIPDFLNNYKEKGSGHGAFFDPFDKLRTRSSG
jgi:hypothetical protein